MILPNHKVKCAYAGFFAEVSWQWYATLTFEHNTGENKIKRLRLSWTRELCTTEKIQVAYLYVEAIESGLHHLHLLMIGSNKNSKTLSNVDHHQWEAAWPYIARIDVPNSNIAVSKYLTNNMAQHGSDYDFYNIDLLKKHSASD